MTKATESATWTRAEDGSSRQPPTEWLHIFPAQIRPAVQAVARRQQ